MATDTKTKKGRKNTPCEVPESLSSVSHREIPPWSPWLEYSPSTLMQQPAGYQEIGSKRQSVGGLSAHNASFKV